jgi:hypothetical protein
MDSSTIFGADREGTAAAGDEDTTGPSIGGAEAVYGTKPSTPEEEAAIIALRERLAKTPEYQRVATEAEVYLRDDRVVHRFLCARNHNMAKAEAMLTKHIVWRFETYRPFELRCAKLEEQSVTGKIQCSPHGLDQWGRPILILDNSKENIVDSDAKRKQRNAMEFLAFNLERATRQLQGGVQRWQ